MTFISVFLPRYASSVTYSWLLFKTDKTASFRTAVPIVTLILSYKDFGAQSMALLLGLGSVGWVGFRARADVGLGLESERQNSTCLYNIVFMPYKRIRMPHPPPKKRQGYFHRNITKKLFILPFSKIQRSFRTYNSPGSILGYSRDRCCKCSKRYEHMQTI